MRFNKLIREDPNFWNEVKGEQYTDNIIHQFGLLETGKKLDLIHTNKKKTKIKYWGATFGAVAILLGSYGLYKITYRPQKPIPSAQPVELTVKKDSLNDTLKRDRVSDKKTIVENIQQEILPIQINDLENKKEKEEKPEKTEIADLPKTNEIPSAIISDTLKHISAVSSEGIEPQTISKESKPKVFICGDLSLTNFTTNPSCIAEENGALIFSNNSLKGGTSPYKTYVYSLNEEGNYLDRNQLSSGKYSIKIVDSKGCVSIVPNIIITEKRCLKRIDESFSPMYGETWIFPTIKGISEYTVTLTDMANHLVITKQVSLDEESEWNGELENGTVIQKGVYIVEIKDEQETYFIGSITIIE